MKNFDGRTVERVRGTSPIQAMLCAILVLFGLSGGCARRSATSASAYRPSGAPTTELDKDLLPHLVYTACMASDRERLSANAQALLCRVYRGGCMKEPESQGCKNTLVAYRVDELSKDPSFVLFTAASVGDVRVLRQSIVEGGDPNMAIAVAGTGGWTPVMIASAEGRPEAVSELLKAGSDPNRQSALGRTPLMFAASYGFTAIVKELLDHGADPNVVPTDHTGWTALIAAACGGHAEVVQLLVQRGADAAARDEKGNTALVCAQERGHVEVVRVLRTGPRQ